jgi:4-amino-4-deoxy-L-arabinose transferase-like glycosyltransferase
LLLILSSLLYLYGLGERDLITRNESEVALAGIDIADNGHIMVPYFFGRPFVDNRPPGAFWPVAAIYKFTGVRNVWAARLPSALAAMICIFMVYAIGRRIAGVGAGYIAAMMLMLMPGFTLQARMSQENMLLTLWTLLFYWAFWRSLDEKRHALRYALAFQLFFGCAALTKGPAAVINAGPLALYMLYSRRWRQIDWRAYLMTLPIGLLLVFGWYLYIWIEWPSMRDILISRFTNQSNIHTAAIYYYLEKLPELLGLELLFLPFLVYGWRKAPTDRKRGGFGLFLIAAAGIFLLYHLFPSKRLHYIVSLSPMLAVCLGVALEETKLLEKRVVATLSLIAAAVGPVLALSWIFVASFVLKIGIQIQDWLLLPLTACSGVWTWMIYRKWKTGIVWSIFWSGAIVVLAFVLGSVYPRVDNLRSLRSFAEAVAVSVPAGARIGSLKEHAALPFYAKREMEIVYIPEAESFLDNPNHYLIGLEDELDYINSWKQRSVLCRIYRRDRSACLLHNG